MKAINDRLPGVEAELVQLPFKWYPETQLLKDMAAWRLVDLSESNGHTIDLCIATKYPTYLARHPNKITWLVHQHRVFYDLEGSEFDVPHDIDDDKLVRKKVRATDGNFLADISPRRYFCNQCHVAQLNSKPLVGNDFVDMDELLSPNATPAD